MCTCHIICHAEAPPLPRRAHEGEEGSVGVWCIRHSGLGTAAKLPYSGSLRGRDVLVQNIRECLEDRIVFFTSLTF